MDLNTNRKLKDGTEVKLGDKLKGESTHEFVVLKDESTDIFCVEAINNKMFVFGLDHFLNSWDDLKITGSILNRTK